MHSTVPSADLRHVGFLRSATAVAGAERLAHLLKQRGLRRTHRRSHTCGRRRLAHQAGFRSPSARVCGLQLGHGNAPSSNPVPTATGRHQYITGPSLHQSPVRVSTFGSGAGGEGERGMAMAGESGKDSGRMRLKRSPWAFAHIGDHKAIQDDLGGGHDECAFTGKFQYSHWEDVGRGRHDECASTGRKDRRLQEGSPPGGGFSIPCPEKVSTPRLPRLPAPLLASDKSPGGQLNLSSVLLSYPGRKRYENLTKEAEQ